MPQSFGHWGSGSHGTLKMYSHKAVLLTFLCSLWCTETSAVVTLMFVVLSSCWRNTSLVARAHPLKSLAFASRSRILQRVRSPMSFTDHVLVKGGDTEVQSVQPRQRDCLSQCPQCQGGQKYVLGKPGSPRKTAEKSSREESRGWAGNGWALCPPGGRLRNPVLELHAPQRAPPLPSPGFHTQASPQLPPCPPTSFISRHCVPGSFSV